MMCISIDRHSIVDLYRSDVSLWSHICSIYNHYMAHKPTEPYLFLPIMWRYIRLAKFSSNTLFSVYSTQALKSKHVISKKTRKKPASE